jgi:hypothetical protein
MKKRRRYRNYTDSDLISAAKEVKSIAGLIKKLGLVPAGGNYAHMKKHIQRLNVDCGHWTGQSWSKGEMTKDWSSYYSYKSMKPHLIKERGHKCECCQLEMWLNKQITLAVHHIDEDRTNNDKDNLQLVCPNCHSYTNNFRRPKHCS